MRKQLTESRYGRYTVLHRDTTRSGKNAYWVCRCDCGTERSVRIDILRNGAVVSCGCYNADTLSARATVHGHARDGAETPTYRTWHGMLQRCSNPANKKWPDYGGRGIRVCDRWAQSFEAFVADMGERPDGKTLDRLDPHGDYTPDNCRWATVAEQNRHKRLDKRNRSGVSGVLWERTRWVARLGSRVLGRFAAFEDAVAARRMAEQREWGAAHA